MSLGFIDNSVQLTNKIVCTDSLTICVLCVIVGKSTVALDECDWFAYVLLSLYVRERDGNT